MPELHWAEVLVRVVLAGILGGAIGAERELREREAGLRTHMLVAVGAALFTIVSAYATSCVSPLQMYGPMQRWYRIASPSGDQTGPMPWSVP